MEQQKHNPKVEWGFYATTPRVVRTQYKNITLVEKWLYVCLKDLCGDTGTCYRTLRVLASETDLALGTLSIGIRHLHDAGLIHAEKKRRSNNPTAKEVWHVTIVDIWQENAKVHPTAQRSPNEQHCSSPEHYTENVQEMNNNVHVANNDASERSPGEQQCSNFDDRSNNIEVRTITEERTMEEESTGKQSDTATSASSLSLDVALSLSDIETHSQQGDTHDTTPLDCPPGAMAAELPVLPSEAIMAAESRTAGDLGTPHGVQPASEHNVPSERVALGGERDALVDTRSLPGLDRTRNPLDRPGETVREFADGTQQEIDEEWCNAETEHRLPAIPKPLPGGTSHEQNRDAFPPRSVAVEHDLGAVASVPIPPVPPEVTPPRTIKATVVKPPEPTLTVVPKRPKKNVEQDKPAIIPKCDTREIQQRVNEHRGYALEEDVDIIRERKAIKTWCNLHSFEDYSAVMEALKRDKYWGKDENYYRIGGLTLLKETSRCLSGREQTIATPANGQGRTQQWRSSFDDPNYDMSAEFYPSEAERSRKSAAAQ